MPRGSGHLGDAPLAARRICRAGAEGVFRRNATRRNRRLSVVRAVHEPTRSESEGEQVCGPDVILTTGVKGAREDARVKIMSYPPKERSD